MLIVVFQIWLSTFSVTELQTSPANSGFVKNINNFCWQNEWFSKIETYCEPKVLSRACFSRFWLLIILMSKHIFCLHKKIRNIVAELAKLPVSPSCDWLGCFAIKKETLSSLLRPLASHQRWRRLCWGWRSPSWQSARLRPAVSGRMPAGWSM